MAKSKPIPTRPEVFGYYDYREFLRDWFAFLKATRSISMKGISEQAGVAISHLPLVLTGRRHLSLRTFSKLSSFLLLSPNETKHLEKLIRLGRHDSFEESLSALDQMERSAQYKKRNPKEAEFFEYTRNWHYIVIREMATLKEFKADPIWIQKHLKHNVPLAKIEAALNFLVEKGYLEINEQGVAIPPKELLDCKGTVLTAALSKFHKQMLLFASNSIESSSPSERAVYGYTVSISAEQYEEADRILKRALDEIEKLEKEAQTKKRDVVYHFELSAFPVSKRTAEGSES